MQIGSTEFEIKMNITLNWPKLSVDLNSPPEKSAEKPAALQLAFVAAPRSERGSVSRSGFAEDTRQPEFPDIGANGPAAGRRPTLRFGCGFALVFALALFASMPEAQAAPFKTQNVFLIISDGFRWQEVFNGAEAELMTKDNGGVKDTNALRSAFWRATALERREALLPFFWTEIARRGQLFGNQNKGSLVTVTNGKKFSYPGYNEILTGAPDSRIDSNDKKPNANVTVFEWLNGRPGLRNKVAVFGTWDVFPYIFNIERSHLSIWPVWESKFGRYEIPPPQFVADLLRDTTPVWEDVTYDAFVYHAAIEHVKHKQPRLMFVGFGETDEWAHAGRYDLYLTAARHMDDFVRRLWELAQSLPQYRDKTTFIITADHGRGSGPVDWKSHGEKIASSEGDWIAVMGPDTPPAGERTQTEPHTQGQIAATIAALLGEDYQAAFPTCGASMADLLAGGEAQSGRRSRSK